MRIIASLSAFARKHLVSMALAGASFSAACTPQTVVNAPSTNAPTRGISVSGLGKANGKPNVARSGLGIRPKRRLPAPVAAVLARLA